MVRDPARARHGPRRSYLPDFFFDLRDVCEDEEDHEQRERSQHPAPELQLHGGFAPTGTHAGRRKELGLEGAAAGAGASARGAQRGRHPALRASPGRRRRRWRQRQTRVAQAQRAGSLPLSSRPPLLSTPLPSIPPPRAGLRAQFDSFAQLLCPPPPTPVNSSVQPPAFASPAWLLSAPEGVGMWPEPATPRLRRLGSGHRVRPRTELSPGKNAHRPAYSAGWQTPSLARSLSSALGFSQSFPDTKTNTWGQPPRATRRPFQPGRCFSS